MVRTSAVLLTVFATCQRYSQPFPPMPPPDPRAASSKPGGHDAPSKCVDGPSAVAAESSGAERKASNAAQQAVAKGITGLGVCAEHLAKPSNVLATVDFRADGSVGRVKLERASTNDCRALECVRQKLAKVKGPASDKGLRGVGFSFVLRKSPPPDGWEDVVWDPASDDTTCIDRPTADAIAARRPPHAIQETVRAAYVDFRKCYEAGLGRDRTLRGRVDVRFHIDESGKVTEAAVVANQVADCAVVACIRDRMRSLVFPKATEPTDVLYPINLEPDEDEAPPRRRDTADVWGRPRAEALGRARGPYGAVPRGGSFFEPEGG